jgi:hypothetical protein
VISLVDNVPSPLDQMQDTGVTKRKLEAFPEEHAAQTAKVSKEPPVTHAPGASQIERLMNFSPTRSSRILGEKQEVRYETENTVQYVVSTCTVQR